MCEKVKAEEERLAQIFGRKRLLSPADVAPLIGAATGTLANQRANGFHLIPSRKIGGKVGFYIGDVAAYLVNGSSCQEQAATPAVAPSLVPKSTRRKGGLTSGAWMLAMRETMNLNAALVSEVEKFTLQKAAKSTFEKS